MPGARAAAAAVAFLTRIPVRAAFDGDDVARGTVAFPIVGLGIGAATGAVADALAALLGAPLAALLGVAVGTVLTGALHLDGIADAADALGATTREHALEIMRDHRVGVYGAVALFLTLGVKVTAIAELAAHGDAARLTACSAAVARVVPVLLGVALPYARAAGTGGFLAGAGRLRAAVALVIGAALCAALGAPWLAVVPVVAVAVCGVAARAWLGGVTGDVLGASAELTEVAALVVAVAAT